jgi:flagellar biosynthesis/type III secretory pathway protein FliH
VCFSDSCMIRARLVPTQLSPDIPVQTFRHTVSLGRQVICEERKRSRAKACRYAKHVRARGFEKGYQEGLAAAQAECAAALQALRNCYEEAINAAKSDTQALATNLAERIIDTTLMARPEVLLAWIQESLQILKRARSLHLAFQPRYQGIMEQVSEHLPDGVTIQADPSLTEADFILSSESGGVEFSWRDILRERPHYSPQEAQ